MEAITPFDNPLLNYEICQYLTRKDLTRCVLVSKDWAAWFSPALWRDLDFRGRRSGDIHILSRHWEHVRVVRNICMWKAGTIREQLPLLRLQRLEIDREYSLNGSHHAQIRLLPVLGKISTLQHLQISLELDRDNIYQQWLRTFEALPQLESLGLRGGLFVSGKAILNFLQMCRRLKSLSLSFSGSEDYAEEEDRQEYRDARAEIERMPELRLCELSFVQAGTDIRLVEENILQPLLGRCPRMEKLGLGWVNQESTMQYLFRTLQENKLVKLRHVSILGFHHEHFQDLFAKALAHVECGMESLEFRSNPTKSVIQSLLQYHSHSLTKLRLECYSILFCTLSELLTGLPNLRVFRAGVSIGRFSEGEIPDKDWECIGLRNLQLQLCGYGSDDMSHPGWKGSRTKIQLDYVFSKVAKLENLQVLSMGGQVKDLYLKKHGYLTQLADLKELQVFDLGTTWNNKFGKREALWMIENWPKLMQVIAQGTPPIFKGTLLKKRPQMGDLDEIYP
ncbi:hypothetical protein BGX34_007068 [Mortierella sp. NVP85]|nr:hypothetical protein BGX34_007068 [Mortierella sp. NVP85]